MPRATSSVMTRCAVEKRASAKQRDTSQKMWLLSQPSTPPTHVLSQPKLLSAEQVIKTAQLTLGMDIVGNYNFAFVGGHGSGKSSLVESFCGRLGYHDKPPSTSCEPKVNAAQTVGPVPHIKLWEVQYTANEKVSEFFNKNLLYAFDCILVVCLSRFTKFDLKLGKLATKWSTPVVYVRSNVDVDLAAAEKTFGADSADLLKQLLREKLEKRTMEDVMLTGMPNPRLYFVSARSFASSPQFDEELLVRDLTTLANTRRMHESSALPSESSTNIDGTKERNGAKAANDWARYSSIETNSKSEKMNVARQSTYERTMKNSSGIEAIVNDEAVGRYILRLDSSTCQINRLSIADDGGTGEICFLKDFHKRSDMVFIPDSPPPDLKKLDIRASITLPIEGVTVQFPRLQSRKIEMPQVTNDPLELPILEQSVFPQKNLTAHLTTTTTRQLSPKADDVQPATGTVEITSPTPTVVSSVGKATKRQKQPSASREFMRSVTTQLPSKNTKIMVRGLSLPPEVMDSLRSELKKRQPGNETEVVFDNSRFKESKSKAQITVVDELGCDEFLDVPVTTIKMAGVAKKIRESRKALQISDDAFNIAVVGGFGSGKSTLVNALRRVNERDSRSAVAGFLKPTTETKAFAHPDLPEVVIWDFPAGGTVRNPAKGYFDAMMLNAFDYLIIVTVNWISDLDRELCMKAASFGVPTVIVRNKAVDALVSLRSELGSHVSLEAAKHELRVRIWSEVGRLPTQDLFIVSGWAFSDSSVPRFDEDRFLAQVEMWSAKTKQNVC